MRYLTHYEQYPIFEAAEGGYCYSGNEVADTTKASKRKCRKAFEEIWEECKSENLADFGAEEPEFNKDKYGNRIYPWYRISPNMIVKYSRYIGEGESYVIERRLGSKRKGWHPYC